MASPVLPPILIAEDDPNDLFLVRRHLAKGGVANPVIAFGGGEELIDFLRTQRPGAPDHVGGAPCVLFLDIKMPRCDGFQVLRWVRAQEALRTLKIVVLSGSDEPRDVHLAEQLGADRYLTKYPPPEVFLEIVQGAQGMPRIA